MVKKTTQASKKTAAATAKTRAATKTTKKATQTRAAKSSATKAKTVSTKAATAKVSAKQSSATQKNVLTRWSLQTWHKILAAIYALQGIALLVFGTSFALPITASFLTKNPLANDGQLVATNEYLFDLNIAYLLAGTLFVAAIVHIVIATLYSERYVRALAQKVSYARWIVFGVISGLALTSVALSVGIYNSVMLVLLLVLTIVGSLGLIAAELAQSKAAAASTLITRTSYLVLVLPWLAIAAALVDAALYGAGGIAANVYILAATIFVLFVAYMMNVSRQRKAQGRWQAYEFGERLSVLIVFAIVTATAWQIFASMLG